MAMDATCSTANAGRAAMARVASTSQRGARASGTKRRNALTAIHATSANNNAAPAKPPTLMRPSLTSRAAATISAANPRNAPSSTPRLATLGVPTSRLSTRSGGTRASCSTGGRPKPSSNVRPTPSPSSAGIGPGHGSPLGSQPVSSATKPRCSTKPSASPARLPTRPNPRNSMACTAAMRFCVWPSTRSMAQSSRWRCAKSRAATATATADSSAVSSATRLRNC